MSSNGPGSCRLLSFSFFLLLGGGCGSVVSPGEDGSVAADGSVVDDAEPSADVVTPDADNCEPFDAPTGAMLLHDVVCTSALGFNPQATPTSDTLPCPGVGDEPGTYGKVLRPDSELQPDGCPATAGITRLLAVSVNTALTQVSTAQDLTLVAGDVLRVRLSCPDATDGCSGDAQITAVPPGGGAMPVFPVGGGFQRVEGDAIVDIEVEIPENLLGPDRRLVFIVRNVDTGTADLLVQNPHIVR